MKHLPPVVWYLMRIFAGVWLATLVVTAGFAAWEIRDDRARVADALRRRAAIAAETLADASEPVVDREGASAFARILRRFTTAERRIAVFDSTGRARAVSSDLRPALPELTDSVAAVLRGEGASAGERSLGSHPRWVHVQPLGDTASPRGAAVVVLDADELETHAWNLGGRTAVRIGVLVLALTGILWFALRWTIVRPVARMAEWTKQLTATEPSKVAPRMTDALFGPLAHEVVALAGTLARARAAAAREARLRLSGESVWTEERLKQYVQLTFGGRPIFVVSNRQPVSHVRDGRTVRELQPASGLVTAIEPIMLACGGVWVAHGSGNADHTVGERVPLPTVAPTYTLRRVWLTDDEESGYYYGFANEGLWPLCHIVHVRPQFRVSDWEQYRAVNRKFAHALLHEIEGTKSPIILVQDYHFALLPEMVKRVRPDAQIALFWHIPWPNFEAFGICPWQDEILLGMLGADLVGFHTQFHCNNFLDTVERSIEARVDWDHFAITRGRRTTHVLPFPISVGTDGETYSEDQMSLPSVEFLGVGVERVDYTKGLPERFMAIRRFFERWPQYRRRVTFLQIAAPSREKIVTYRELQDRIDKLVSAINAEIGDADWMPIDYRARHHSHGEIRDAYRGARFCMVTSLHDGMNLVAKEFVASRTDDRGVLILSRFAGAARELPDALRVNPYDVESMAEAIRLAIEMSPDDERHRMRRMRHWVREHNIYRWTGQILARLSQMGGPETAPQTPPPSQRRG